MPPPLTFSRALLPLQFEPLPLLFVGIALALYALGVRRVRRAGRRWPAARSAAYYGGVAVVAFATLAGLAAYDSVLFSVHMAQHLMLGLAGPMLLSLGAPVTLLLGASGQVGRRRIGRLLASRPVGVLTHPAVAWLLFVASPFALYFSPLYELSLRHGVVHALVHAHFLIVGSLFCWPLVGADPVPHRQSPGARMLFAVLTLPFHAFLGVAIMGSSTLLAGDYYAGLGRTWGGSLIQEQNAGGGLLWVAGDLIGLVLVVLLLREWARSDDVIAAREDLRIDAAERAAGRPAKDATRPY